MQHVELTVKGLSYSQGKSGAYALILAEIGEGGRKLPVVIGGAEAQSSCSHGEICSTAEAAYPRYLEEHA